MTAEEIQKVAIARWNLAFHERASFLVPRGGGWGGTALLDLGDILSTEIEIDDHSSVERETEPYAHLYLTDGNRRRVETVDIHASVSTNPSSIGHPAIVAAVRHWERLLFSMHLHMRTNRGNDDPDIWATREVFIRRHVQIAEYNLEALAKALVYGAKKRSVSPQPALVSNLEEMRVENRENIVYLAWEELRKWNKPTQKFREFQDFETALRTMVEREPVQSSGISLSVVQSFFDEKHGSGGDKYLLHGRRPSWATFRNAFAAWYFGVDVGTLKSYPAKTKNEHLDQDEIVDFVAFPRSSSLRSILGSILSGPLVFARDPIVLSEDEIITGIEDAIHGRKLPFVDDETK